MQQPQAGLNGFNSSLVQDLAGVSFTGAVCLASTVDQAFFTLQKILTIRHALPLQFISWKHVSH